MFLKKMKLLNFIRKKINFKKNQTYKRYGYLKNNISDKEHWLNGDGPQTD